MFKQQFAATKNYFQLECVGVKSYESKNVWP